MRGGVAVIPARDEEARVPLAIASLRRRGLRVIVVANGCRDRTATAAHQAGATVIEAPALHGGVGQARRIGFAAALRDDPSWLLTTDADCVVPPGTIPLVLHRLERCDAVFGRVEPDATEFARLPPIVRRHGALEDRRDALRAHLDGLLAPEPWDPLPRHGQSPGAFVAFRTAAYLATGGFAPVPCHEDRLLAEALDRIGARVARPWGAVVRASCRLKGRAPGGMADSIAERTRIDLTAQIQALEEECETLATRIAAVEGGAEANLLPFLPVGSNGPVDRMPTV